jgi:tetratricopeptide (TPR) repeat protein
MANRSPESSARSNPAFRYSPAHLSSTFLAAVALGYALLAGLRTVQDFDLGWQLATGRWLVQHRHIFSTDVFSYTAAGQPWIYPVLSGIAFYFAYLAGGYALLSWMGALTCAGTVGLLLRRQSLIGCALAVIAVPLIANRTQPRAEMFSTVLFAALLTVLWQHYRHNSFRARLWVLPILMVGWVNLHLGFVAGLAICGVYVFIEALDLPFPAKRPAALAHLRRAWPWLALTLAATLVNPWGASIYMALVRQARAQNLHSSWIVEWGDIHPSWASLHQALDWRDPQSCFWWLMLAAVVSAGAALWRKQWGAAVLLIAAAYLTLQHVRLQALFACIVVVSGGTLLDELRSDNLRSDVLRSDVLPKNDLQKDDSRKTIRHSPASPTAHTRRHLATAGTLLVTIALTGLAVVRSSDLVSNRYYMRTTQLSRFGTGLSWWYPERAVEFLQREQLPGNVFNGYSLGGFLTWRLFPEYRDYIDSRALPFGPELFFRAYDLSVEPPDSPAWQLEAEARGVNTILVPLARYQGMTLFPQLHSFCQSQSWRPVYLDEVSAIFVRRTPQTAALIDRLQVNCETKSLDLPGDLNALQSSSLSLSSFYRAKTELFNFWANAGGVLYSLERYPEALAYLDRAQSVFADNANVHLLRALVLQQIGRAADAEAEFRASLRLEPSDESWFDFGLFYMTQKRYAEAAEVFRQSAESSSRPHEMWMMLGQADLQMHQPMPALEAFDKAVDSSPFGAEGESLGASFNSLIATGRAKAWYQLGDLPQAVSFQEEAVKLAPGDAKLWLGLADLYEAQGRTTLAGQARVRASENKMRPQTQKAPQSTLIAAP